jgi:hypothetical protein
MSASSCLAKTSKVLVLDILKKLPWSGKSGRRNELVCQFPACEIRKDY